jgi:hypothetical protein
VPEVVPLEDQVDPELGGVPALRPVFMEVDRRRVHLAGITAQPTGGGHPGWEEHDDGPRRDPDRFRFLIRDRDVKFTACFDAVFAGAGVEVVKIPPRSPRERVRRAVGAHRTDRVPGLAADLEQSAPAPRAFRLPGASAPRPWTTWATSPSSGVLFMARHIDDPLAHHVR